MLFRASFIAFLALVGASSNIARRQPAAGEERSFEIASGSGVKMVFCWIPLGKAKLGSPMTEKERDSDEVEHDYQTTGFWLAKYPVTQEEWRAVMGNNPSYFDGKADNKAKGLDTKRFPVEQVAWDDPEHPEFSCQKFLEKVNKREGIGAVFGKGVRFVLPHEDQWEYACRGGLGNGRPFYWGDALNGTQANCDGDYPYGTTATGQNLGRTCKVDFTNDGKYEKHPWGLCHMSGNVRQWCENSYDATGSDRVFRGGCWSLDAGYCRSAYRYRDSPEYRSSYLGFRVALVPSGP